MDRVDGVEGRPRRVDAVDAIPRRLQDRQVRGLLSSVPERASILEIDAIDGHRNLYHLPAGCSITQWLEDKPTATEEFKTNQTAKTKELDVRTVLPRAPDRPPKLPTDKFDVAFGVRCLQRALARGGQKAAKRLVDEVLASCAPHTGKFCFIEGTEMESTLAEILDEHPLVRDCDVIVDKGSLCGWARRNRRNPREKALSKRIAEKGGLGGGLAAAAASAKKRKAKKKR